MRAQPTDAKWLFQATVSGSIPARIISSEVEHGLSQAQRLATEMLSFCNWFIRRTTVWKNTAPRRFAYYYYYGNPIATRTKYDLEIGCQSNTIWWSLMTSLLHPTMTKQSSSNCCHVTSNQKMASSTLPACVNHATQKSSVVGKCDDVCGYHIYI